MSQKIKIAFLTILGLMLINCSSVFALNNVSKEIIDTIMTKYGCAGAIGKDDYNSMIADLDNPNYYKFVNVIRNGEIHVWISNNPYYTNDGGSISGYVVGHYYNIIYNKNLPGYVGKVSINGENYVISRSSPRLYIYAPNGVYKTNSTEFYLEENYESSELIKDLIKPKEPYFEFSASKVGTTTIENYEGNIPCYYTTSFPRWTNSYSTNREIGSLYIDKNYILEDIFYPAIYINKYNWEQTKQWNYTGYQFFKEEEINGYLRYSISIENNLLTAPYFYNLNLKSIDTNLSEDLNINFGVINKPNTGGTITDNSGDTISGDEIKDNTTPGDINNTLEEIFQEPDEGELKKQQEENINEIKEQITNELNNNEVFGALTTAEQGLIEILEGEPRRF